MLNTPSPIDASAIAKASIRMGQLQVYDEGLFWCERRPQEKGRQTVVTMTAGEPLSILPEGYSARSKVHEYGGGDYRVSHGRLFFVNDADQALYVMPLDASQLPLRLSCVLEGVERRYADCVVSPDGTQVVAVQETHRDGVVLNDLVVFSTTSSDQEPVVLVTDVDFVAAPAFSHDGLRLAWVTWGTQEMSWEQSDVWIADWQEGALGERKKLSFEAPCSYLQPTWSASGKLYYSCDLKGHWEIYCYDAGVTERVCALPGECGYPAWVFGCCCFCVDANDVIIAIVGEPGRNQLCRIENGQCSAFDLPVTDFDPTLAMSDSVVFYLASHSSRPKAIEALSLSDSSQRSFVAPASQFDHLVSARAICFPGDDGGDVHAFYYDSSPGKSSPLIVAAHGGPTAYADASYQLAIQFWLSRGYSYLDVNYRGSAGYGRAYRRALLGRWGELDASDCVAAARYAIAHSWADPEQCFIRGGSAGGLTVLNALIHSDVFAAGTSLYGVVDLMTLEEATHKFEASYLISLVGELPQHQDRYRERSPRYHADHLKAPVLFLQGLKDAVVPPSQVNGMMEAMDKAGKPYCYHAYPDEGHGFRSEATLIDSLNREHAFYQDVILKKECQQD